jgi:hypothetical protein
MSKFCIQNSRCFFITTLLVLLFGLHHGASASPDDPPPPPLDVGARTSATTPIMPRGHKHLVAPKGSPTVALPTSRPQGTITATKSLKQKTDQLKERGAK